MDIVGLPNQAVKESRERVQAAIKNSGLPYPRKRIIVNLAPAAVRKEGPAYDLPIALGVLLMQMLVPPDSVDEAMVIGELSLDGTVIQRGFCRWLPQPENKDLNGYLFQKWMQPKPPSSPIWT